LTINFTTNNVIPAGGSLSIQSDGFSMANSSTIIIIVVNGSSYINALATTGSYTAGVYYFNQLFSLDVAAGTNFYLIIPSMMTPPDSSFFLYSISVATHYNTVISVIDNSKGGVSIFG